MATSRLQPPPTKRSFASPWGELDYLCRKLRYWLYTRADKSRAERFIGRLESVLRKIPASSTGILRQEALAILCEVKGQIGQAIAHRKAEIEFMIRLHEIAESENHSQATRDYMLQGRGVADLRLRERILKSLQSNVGSAASELDRSR